MTFIDKESGRTYTMRDVRAMWEDFRTTDPGNHEETFPAECYRLLLDTVNGRNDLAVIGPTVPETCNMIMALRKKIQK